MSKDVPITLVKNFKKHELVLKALKNSRKKKSQLIIDNAPPSLFNLIKSICKYVLTGRLRLGKHQVKKLNRHKKLIRSLARSNHKTVKKHISQKGGGLKSIISTLLPILTTVIPAIL